MTEDEEYYEKRNSRYALERIASELEAIRSRLTIVAIAAFGLILTMVARGCV
jgi:hypothetical protein